VSIIKLFINRLKKSNKTINQKMKQLLTICALFFSSLIMAQSAPPAPAKIGTVSGKIIDQVLTEPVPYASVIIKSKADGSTLTGGITDDSGVFEITDVPEGTLIFEAQFIGYKIYSKEITISSDNRKVDLGTIALEENVET